MRDYKIPTLNINNFSDKEFCCFSFSARDYRRLLLKNSNTIKLKNLLEIKEKVGKEIGSENYMIKSKHRFLKTVNISNNFILDETNIEYCKPENKIFPKKNEILIAKDGGGNGLGETCIYQYENKDNLDSLSAGIIAIKVKEEKRNYVLSFLKSQHFKDFVDLNTAQGSTIRHSKLVSLDYQIPFPTKNNHPNPENVEKLVSLIVQNIIDKEEQIKAKNKQIDYLIQRELKKNQKAGNFKYAYPRISEIKESGRFDTGIFERNYKQELFKIQNYTKGNFYLFDNKIKFISGSTPATYLPSNNKNDYWWLAVADIEYGLFYKKIVKIKLKDEIKNILDDGDILITRKGATVGKMNLFFKDDCKKAFVNEDIKVLRIDANLYQKIFIGMFLKTNYGQTQMLNHGSKGTKQGLTNNNITDVLVPNFPEPKQQEIAKLYYNKLDRNINLTLENYIEKEKTRNQEIGIFQLNMEIFKLREYLENIVHKIVMEEEIKIEEYLEYV